MINRLEELEMELENFSGDKRSKEYKLLKETIESLRDALNSPEEDATESKGLGDVVKDVIQATGLDKLVEPNCQACKNRQSMLNDWGDKVTSNLARVFRGRKVKEMTDDDYSYLSEFLKDGIPSKISNIEQRRINEIYYNVSGIQKRSTSCSPCVVKVVKSLEVYFNQYSKKQ